MADASQTCPACGARVSTGLDRCDMCGTQLASSDSTSESSDDSPESVTDDSEGASSDDGTRPEASDPDADESVYCNQCGHQNPGAANYCSRCGAELEDVGSGSAKERTRSVEADLPKGREATTSADEGEVVDPSDEHAAMGRQIVWMVGIGLLVILGFFFVTQWSQQYEWEETSSRAGSSSEGGGGSPQTAQQQASARSSAGASRSGSTKSLEALINELRGPLQGPVAGKVDSLEGQLQNATGSEKQQVQESLVRMYIGAGAPGRAALIQREIADGSGSVEDQRRAANLLYRWMRKVEQEGDRADVSAVAKHVATAYEAVVEQRPDDLDARTRMGEAYQLTNNPMKGIQAINAVLKEDSTFVPALFQKGLALLKINRLEESIQQFQAVKTYSDAQDPFYKQAERAIEVIREQSSAAGGSANGE